MPEPSVGPAQAVIQIAVPVPLPQLFDYLPGDLPLADLRPGSRVLVPFGNRQKVGLIIRQAPAAESGARPLKAVAALLDLQPTFAPEDLQLLLWAADYYHHPPGEVCHSALPPRLRTPRTLPQHRSAPAYRITAQGRAALAGGMGRATRQQALLQQLADSGPARPAAAKKLLDTLLQRQWIEQTAALPGHGVAEPAIPTNVAFCALSDQQRLASEQVSRSFGRFRPFLLFGVTGSGKTEVYLQLIRSLLAQRRQALLLAPEIGLARQIFGRCQRHFGDAVGLLNSSLAAGQRLDIWQRARDGELGVLVGTRSALFTPLPRLALIIVDEEHDLSYKQQDGFRYHARDLAVRRAQLVNCPVLLGSATPCLETLANVQRQRYQELRLLQRHRDTPLPRIWLHDVSGRYLQDGLSAEVFQRIDQVLQAQGQVLVFLNRRGYAPVVICHRCNWQARCDHCDANLVYHRRMARLICHHCDHRQPFPQRCPGCGNAQLKPVGLGIEQLEEILGRRFPEASLCRIDRDTVQKAAQLETLLSEIEQGRHQILLGTQMLAKGYDFPRLALAVVMDTDQRLFSVDFRAAERLAQLILQIAGRPGRQSEQGQVIIQTQYPSHPLLACLVDHDYPGFAASALAARRSHRLPPFRHQALIRAESLVPDQALSFLGEAVAATPQPLPAGLELLGPTPSPMERLARYFRALLLVQADSRRQLHEFLDVWLAQLAHLRQPAHLRWSVDVDPQEIG